jgi:colanic acid/amylovoran biosynthesis glycosyltransferase
MVFMRRGMRVVFVVDRFPSPSETFTVERFVRLVERGWDVHIVCNSISRSEWSHFPQLSRLSDARDRVHRRLPTQPRLVALALLPYVCIRAALRSPSMFLRYLLRGWAAEGVHIVRRLSYDASFLLLHPDIIHFTFGWFAIGGEHLGRLLDAKIVVSFQGADISFGGLDRDPGHYDAVWRSSDAIHFVSEDLRRRGLRRGLIPAGKVSVVPPGINLDAFTPGPRSRDGTEPLRILSVGRLHWKKGYEYALQAVRELLDRGIDCRYRIIGDGPAKDAVLYARSDLGLEAIVDVLGALPSALVREEMQSADVFLHAATSEGFCVAVIEAQAMGLPVVTSDADGLPDNVQHGETGFVVPRRDPHALATRLAELANDGALRCRLGAAGRERALRVFDVDAEIDGYDAIYRAVLAAPPSAAEARPSTMATDR